MIRKLAKIAFLLVLIFAGTVVTVADHLFIGIIIFIAMIVMVATGPKAGEAKELSELEKAKARSDR
ncbi:MAG: hypothetical protein ACYCY8_00385 [Burkholderiales bacterium]